VRRDQAGFAELQRDSRGVDGAGSDLHNSGVGLRCGRRHAGGASWSRVGTRDLL